MLSGTKVLVTGGSSGIGLAICKVLTRHGARVCGSGRNAAALEELAAAGHVEAYLLADLADSESSSLASLVDGCAERLGGLTAVVNAAGVLRPGAMGDVDVSNYDYNMNTNVRAPFEIMTHAVPHLKRAAADAKASKSGRSDGGGGGGDGSAVSPCIVNISSVNGKQSFPGCVSYCMSKAAVDMMTRCASVDLAKHGIRVNSVNPGMVITNLQKRGGLAEDQYEKFLERQIEVTHPLGTYLGRCGTPEEVGELVAFLLSDKAQFITGECIAMDGGRQNLGAR